MRPPEQDVTLSLDQLHCTTTEDNGGDEPYMWILGFKVDAETMSALPGSLVPNLGVKIIDGVPASPYLKGTGEINANDTIPVPTALGTRWMRLKPALLESGDWFPGIAGIVCILWDQDNFDPGTAEAGFKKFKQLFGPELSTQLNALMNGAFDDELAKDANGIITGNPQEAKTFAWRVARLRESVGRGHAVKAITKRVKDEILNRIKDAIKDEAGWDELLDPDDMLGVNAQIYLGDELSSAQNFTMQFTEDEADYTAKGHAFGIRVQRAQLDSAVTKLQRVFDRDQGVWRRVCWYDMKLYWASAYRQQTTTTFDLRPVLGSAPSSVRWFLDDTLLADGKGSVSVNFEPVDKYAGPPQDVLANFFRGGPSTLTYTATGSRLEISNTGGDGVYFGTVRALYAYPGDPSLFAAGASNADLLTRGYVLEAELGIVAVSLEMNDDYKDDVRRCMRTVDGIDAKHIEASFGQVKHDLGDPSPVEHEVLARARSALTVAQTVVVEVAAPVKINRRIFTRGRGQG